MERDAKLNAYKQLAWSEIEDWAGPGVAQRGERYQRSGRVRDLAISEDGRLVAWVEGTQRYATLVDDDDGPISSCTCPYGDSCKHAVAVVLDYQDRARRKQQVPVVADTDRRLLLLERDDADFDEADWEDGEDEDEDEGDEDEGDEDGVAVTATSSARMDGPLRAFLERQTKTQLVELLEDLARRSPEVRDALEVRRKMASGSTEQLVHDLRREIAAASVRPGWRDGWSGQGYIPDYSRVRDRLDLLLQKGLADDIVALSETLLEAGIAQVEESQDEGETATEIASCMEIVFRALSRSSMPPAQQILWAIDAELEDQYDLCSDSGVFWAEPHPQEAWDVVATTLLERLQNQPAPKNQDDYTGSYRRDRLVDWAIRALRNAGRESEIIPLCEREAERNGAYTRLVALLRSAGRLTEAEAWIIKGLGAVHQTQLGTARQLRETLREMREQAGEWLQVAAMRAEDFFDQPSIGAIRALRSAAEQAGVWPEVRKSVLRYLETGKRPEVAADRSNAEDGEGWPLPETGLPRAEQNRPLGFATIGARQFPLIGVLIELAIDEGQTDQVLHWYDRRKESPIPWLVLDENRIADAIADAYPDRAIAIWKQLTEAQIAQTQVRAYEVAVSLLRKLKRPLERQGRGEEWRRYIAELRSANARKRRLVEMLDALAKELPS